MFSSIISLINKPYIYVPIGLGIYAASLLTKTLYNSPKSSIYNTPIYNTNIIHEYKHTGLSRQYKYTVNEPTFKNISKEYKESLFGNNIIKNNVDSALLDYLKANLITERFLVINIPGWSALIEIQSNDSLSYVVINVH
jgi:hypothetical protein